MDGALLREERYESEQEWHVAFGESISSAVVEFEERLHALDDAEALLEEAISFADRCVEARFAGLSIGDVQQIGRALGAECGMVLRQVKPEQEVVPRWLASMFEFWDANAEGNEVAFWLSVGDQLTGEYHQALVKRWLPFLREQVDASPRRARQVITCLQYVHSYDGRWVLNDIQQNHADPDVRAYADYAMKHRWLR